MLTVLFYLTGKPDAEAPLRSLLKEMIDESRAHDGCITYTFHQQADDPHRWMLLEQWRDRAALKGHVERMKLRFGEPPAGAALPERLHALSASSHYVFYREPLA
jgi:quinol monooxygenase YgiN